MSRTASVSLSEVDSPATATSYISGFEAPSAEVISIQDNNTAVTHTVDISTDSSAPALFRSISGNADVPVGSHPPNLSRSTSSTDATADAPNLSRSVSSIREIYKNSWLKQMPCSDKWTGRIYKSQKPEKFWVVFCVHDDKDAFLEFYENRRSAYSHSPLNSISLSQCLHISPTIVIQDNDHEFVVTLETQVIRLAASTREQMVEWMDTLRNKLRELNVLEPKDNLYTKEPFIGSRASVSSAPLNEPLSSHEDQPQEGSTSQSEMSLSRLSLRDPNSPLPPVPLQITSTSHSRDGSVSSASLVYVRNPSLPQSTSSLTQALVSSAVNGTDSTAHLTDTSNSSPMHNDHVVTRQESSVLLGHNINSHSGNVSVTSSYSVPNTPVTSDACLYEPLFHMTSLDQTPQLSMVAIRNPSYENPPEPQRPPDTESVPVLPPKVNSDSRRFSASSSDQFLRDQRSSSAMLSASQGSLNRPLENTHSFLIRGLSRISQDEASISTSSTSVNSRTSNNRNSVQSEEEESASNVTSAAQPIHAGNSQSYVTALPTDESGRVLSLREAQVLKLQAEILHKSGVRLVLRKKDSVNAIAFVDCFGSVWVAGWKQKEHPLLHNTFHIGDRIFSVAGHRVHNVQEVNKIIKLQHIIVDFVVCRTPCAKVLAIKKEYEGQDLGLVREGGTAEIKEVKPGGLAARYGLPQKAPSMDGSSTCNWFLTEINHRPLNLFFKDNEIHDRLNAVGLDISILVQPIELVKALKKQLKAIRGFKDYTLQ